MIPTPTPIILSNPTAGSGDLTWLLILLVGVIVLQGLAFIRRRRQ